ncbi:unnamed protein product [Lota lota]
MEEEAPAKRSVAELAGKFKNAGPDHELGLEPKSVRRRPPRSLQIQTHTSAEHEKADAALPPFAAGKPKRNSALIEKLQANLALSPSALLPSPKSPGFKFTAPSFTPPCHSTSSLTPVAAVMPVTPTSPQSKEEVPASFETPPSAQDGAMLVSINKSRARLSIKRRPPSRRNRTSSSGEEGVVSPSMEDTPLLAPSNQPGEEKPKGEGEAEGAAQQNQEVFDQEEATSEGVHGPLSAMDHEGPAVTPPGPPPELQAPNSTETNGGGGGGEGGGGGSEERGTQREGQSEREPDECPAMGEEEEGASRSQDGPVGDGVSGADMKDEEESRDHKADEGQMNGTWM